jgi:hypothetical protein
LIWWLLVKWEIRLGLYLKRETMWVEREVNTCEDDILAQTISYKYSKNGQISIHGFQCVAINIKDWLNICT